MSINFLESAVFHCLIKESSFCQILFIFQKKKIKTADLQRIKTKQTKNRIPLKEEELCAFVWDMIACYSWPSTCVEDGPIEQVTGHGNGNKK